VGEPAKDESGFSRERLILHGYCFLQSVSQSALLSPKRISLPSLCLSLGSSMVGNMVACASVQHRE
jgi:hypothetical protein